MSQQACESCRFWQELRPGGSAGYAADRNYHVEDDGFGICRRNPPRGVRRDTPSTDRPLWADDAAYWAQWPVTSGDLDWCGEYQVDAVASAAAVSRATAERYRKMDMPGPSTGEQEA